MSLVPANGWRFDCGIAGDGPDLVFVHGEIHGTVYWEHQVAELSGDYRCLVYHRRGHGPTGAPGGGYELENQRRDVEALIERFGIVDPVIVAVAFGTAIAVDYAIANPGKVRGIVMVAWSELHDAPGYLDRWMAANGEVVRVLREGGRDALVEYLRREAGRSLYFVIPLDSPIREPCIRMFAAHPIEEYERGMLEFAKSVPDLVTPFAGLDIPVIGICGSEDPFPDRPETLAGMASFRELPPVAGASRFVQWERPRAFNAALHDFLATLPPPSR